MKKYMFKRILFSIFSLLVVVMLVMVLVYTMIERNVIFQTDDMWNKKSNNDRSIYEYAQYEKYGYLTYRDYTSFVKDKYVEIYGEEYFSQPDYLADKNAVQDPDNFQSNATVQEFIQEYQAKGYTFKYFAPMVFKSGKTKPGGQGYLLAVHEKMPVLRLFDYIKLFFPPFPLN